MAPIHLQNAYPSLTPDAMEGSKYLNSQSALLEYEEGDCTTSIDDINDSNKLMDLTIYSANKNLEIAWNVSGVKRLHIYDTLGRLKKSVFLNGAIKRIQLPFDDARGIYVCQFVVENLSLIHI